MRQTGDRRLLQRRIPSEQAPSPEGEREPRAGDIRMTANQDRTENDALPKTNSSQCA